MDLGRECSKIAKQLGRGRNVRQRGALQAYRKHVQAKT
jgi:hypothetical protein